MSIPQQDFTDKQGQYLAFIYMYTKVNGQPPAHADIQRYFKVTPPTVNSMLIRLRQLGFIRKSRQARSIEVLLQPEHLPPLR